MDKKPFQLETYFSDQDEAWAEFFCLPGIPDFVAASKVFQTVFSEILHNEYGFVTLQETTAEWVRLINVFILPEYRGMTHGHDLLKMGLDRCKELGVEKVSATVTCGNRNWPKTAPVDGPLGFKLEAVLKKHANVLGQPRDVLIYSIFLK